MNINGCFLHNSDEWFTPFDLFLNLHNEFNFNLDPCGSKFSPVSIYIGNFFSIDDDGLVKSWAGSTCFVNPPYSNISEWVQKCYQEYLNGSTIVLLIPSRTDTKYFHDFILPFCELRFIKGRLKFSNSKYSAPFPSMLCIYRGCIDV